MPEKDFAKVTQKRDVIVINCSQVAEQLEAFKIQGLVVIGGFEAFHSVLQLSENRFCRHLPTCIGKGKLAHIIWTGTSTRPLEFQWLFFQQQSRTMSQVFSSHLLPEVSGQFSN